MITPVVTTHAVDRFIERFPGAERDRKTAEREIAGIVARGIEHGAIGVILAGCTFVLEGNRVVTVLPGRRMSIDRQTAFCRERMAGRARA